MTGDLFAGKPLLPRSGAEWQRHEMTLEGRYHDDGTRVSVSYEESELSGMEGSRVTISFHKSERGLISMTIQEDQMTLCLNPMQGKVDLFACPYLSRLRDDSANRS